MKRSLRRCIFLAAFVLVLGSAPASRADLPWQVDKMQVAMAIEPAGRLRVEETIAFNLGPARHHYLTRRIALRTPAEAGGRRLDIRIHAITDGRGHPWPARVREWDDELEIRIGNGETFLTGPQDLLLVYDVEGAIRAGRVRDELHWDVTGGPWEGPIVDLTVTVALPPGAAPEMIDAGARTQRLGEEPRPADLKAIDAEHARFMLPRGLRVRETMRISMSWPAELMPRPGPLARLGRTLLRRPWWMLPIAVLGVIGLRLVAARRRLRSRLAADAASPRSPIEIGLLADRALRPRHLVAAVLDLAQRGALRIEPAAGGDRGRFILRRASGEETTPGILEYESLLLDALVPPSQTAQLLHGDLALRVAAALPAIARAARSQLEGAGEFPSACRLRRWRPAALTFVAAFALGVLIALAIGAAFPAALCGIGLAALSTALVVGLANEARVAVSVDRTRIAEAQLQGDFGTFLPVAVAVGTGAEWIQAHAGSLERPAYFPASSAGDAGEAGELFSDLMTLSEPFRIVAPDC